MTGGCGDGRIVAFNSSSWNLIEGDRIPHSRGNVYTRDRLTGTLERHTFAYDGDNPNNGSGWAAVARNGRWVAFKSWASNLVTNDNNFVADIYIHNLVQR